MRNTDLAKRPVPPGGLDPTKDGALLTGDRNLIHVQFDVTYAVSDALAAETNVTGYEELVRAAIRRAAVMTASKWTADAIMLMKEAPAGAGGKGVRGATFAAAVRQAAQARLDEMQAGVTIHTLNPTRVTLPLAVLKSYEAVRSAESKANTMRAEAAYEATQALHKAAGAKYRLLLGEPDKPLATRPAGENANEPYFNLIGQYDRAVQAGQEKEAAALMETIGQQLESNQTGGQAGQIVAAARAEESRIVQEAQTWLERYQKLLPHYKAMGSTLLELELASTLEKMFSSPTVEKVVLQSGSQKVILQTSEDQEIVERVHKAIAALKAQREKELKEKTGGAESPP